MSVDLSGDHASALLKILAERGNASVPELTDAIAAPREPVRALLAKLTALGLAEPTGDDRYRLGPRLADDLLSRVVVDLWDENLHQGYWHSEFDQASNRVATEQLTDVLLERSGVSPGERVLDVGCGVGTPAARLAEATGAQVVGVTNDPAQVAEATRRIAARGLADRVSFQRADALDLPFPADSFDVAWLLEILAVVDRSSALTQVARVLRPGGRVVIADQVIVGDPDAAVLARIEEYAASTGSSLVRAVDYQTILAGAGLEQVELLDISEHTRRTAVRIIEAVDQRREELLRRYGRAIAPVLEMFRSTVPLLPEVGYAVVVARKLVRQS